jgi:hypothetical protein
MLVRHELDAGVVASVISAAVNEHEKHRVKSKANHDRLLAEYASLSDKEKARWTKPPTEDSHQRIDDMCDEWIAREKTYYALVRVVENTEASGNRFVLTMALARIPLKAQAPSSPADGRNNGSPTKEDSMKSAALFTLASPVLVPAIALCFVVAIPIVIVHMVIPSIRGAYIP